LRLIDCFTGLIAYTAFSMKGAEQNQLSFDRFKEDVDRLLTYSEDLSRKQDFSGEDYDMARFAVCAWVDESVLCSAWEGREQWEHQQLQRVHYDTTNAGEEFFERLEQIEPENKGLLEVYSTCLSLGFAGRYYAVKSRLDLEETGKQVLEESIKEVVDPFGEEDDKLFPSAYLDPKLRARKRLRLGALPIVISGVILGAGIIAGLYIYFDIFLDGQVAKLFG
jgi:type VI secretion system protein ImpK